MRLWHKDLIDVLPRKQLLSQWRECCCIASNIANKGTPNHLLVNKVLKYTPSDFRDYCDLVANEMNNRKYKVNYNVYSKCINDIYYGANNFNNSEPNPILFKNWHNEEYLSICYYNLLEKYRCGGISENEWIEFENKYKMLLRMKGE